LKRKTFIKIVKIKNNVSSETDLRTRAAKSQIARTMMSDSSSEEGPPTKIIDLEKTQVYPINNLTKSALRKVYREVGLHYRNDTAQEYCDIEHQKIECSNV